jgi:hypothetical protein
MPVGSKVFKKLDILVACEFSSTVRDAFIRKGHNAVSCDFLEADGPHYRGNVLDIIEYPWDMLIAFPPCTYLCSSGLHRNIRDSKRQVETEKALRFVKVFFKCRIPRIAIENPVGCISTRIRKPDQIIQPWQFGHDASKKTCLWLKNLPLLVPTKIIKPRMINGLPRWANQTDSGQNRLAPSEDRAMIRSITYKGIAEAMAEQWG